jgi:hypothetical protein
METLMVTLDVNASPVLSTDQSPALGVASIVALVLVVVALVAALRMPLTVDESGFEASAAVDRG